MAETVKGTKEELDLESKRVDILMRQDRGAMIRELADDIRTSRKRLFHLACWAGVVYAVAATTISVVDILWLGLPRIGPYIAVGSHCDSPPCLPSNLLASALWPVTLAFLGLLAGWAGILAAQQIALGRLLRED